MQRWQKRIWTGSLISGAVLLIIAAVLLGSVRLVDQLAPRYRQTLANTVTEAIEQPVEVGSIGMRWRRFRPTVQLGDVVVLNPDSRLPVFRLREIQVPFQWTALLRGQFLPAEVVLAGMALTLEWRADGTLGVQGIEMLGSSTAGDDLDLADVFRRLRQLGHVVITDSKLAWLEFGEPLGFTAISDLNAELIADVGRYRLSLQAQLPEHLGERLRMQASLEAEAASIDELDARISIQADGLRAQGWLQSVLQPDITLRGGPASVQIESRWHGLQPETAHLQLEAAPQAKWRGDEMLQVLPGLVVDASLQAEDQGWKTRINRLQYRDADGDGPAATGELSYEPLLAGLGTRLHGRLDTVRIADLLAWTSVLGMVADLPIPEQATGLLQNLAFDFKQLPGHPPDVIFKTDLQGLSMPFTDPLPGLSGLHGSLNYDGQQALIELQSTAGELVIPQVFAHPVPLTRLDARLRAQPVEAGWTVSTEALSLKANTVEASGALSFSLYEDERAPEIDLDMTFSATDALPAKLLIPVEPVLPEEVGEWLQDAILGGSVPQGEFVLKGPLDKFPFVGADKAAGEFRVEFDVVDAVLEYAPGWPQVSKVQGRAAFIGQSMRVDARSGEILGVPVQDVQARISDFEQPLLTIKGQVRSDLKDQLSFLAESPLREDYQGLLEVLTVEGPGVLDLDLRIPLDNVDDTRVSGDVLVQGARLNFDGMPEPVENVQGKLSFTEAGLSGEGLTGQFLGLPATADLQPQETLEGIGTALRASIDVAMPEHTQNLRRLLGDAPPYAAFAGKTRVQIRGLFDSTGKTHPLQIDTNLQGMTVNLGSPLRKGEQDLRPVRIGVWPGAEKLIVDWRYVEALHGKVELHSRGDSWLFQRGVLRLGALPASQPPVLPQGRGWDVQGELPVLDLGGLSLGGPGGMPDLLALKVQLGLLKVAGQSMRNIGIQLDPDRRRLNFTGSDSEGSLQWREQRGRLMLDADFKRLSLSVPRDFTDTDKQEDSPPLDPARLPGLALKVQQFIVGEVVLGSLDLQAQPIPSGLRLELFDLSGKSLELRGGGEWLRQNGKSSAELLVNLNSTDIHGLLQACGFVPNITAAETDIFVDVQWRPEPLGLLTSALNGKLHFDMKNGSLLAVEPGAGRVLSLLSFYSLPRRLTLDFRDVMGKGTVYDKLEGKFRIEDGNAFTDNRLKVESPAMEIDVRGRVGFVARDYDQTVTIQPELSASVSLAGALLGGPVLGIGLWLAQEILDEPFERASKLTYRMTGSWDDPVIEPVRGSQVPATESRPERPATGPRK